MEKIRQSQFPILYCLIATLALLDGLEIFERIQALEKLGHFSCALLPFANISSLFIPSQLTEFAIIQCPDQIEEPGISIIFLMMKNSFVLMALLISWVFLGLFHFQEIQKKFLTRVNEGIWNSAKKSGASFFGLILVCGYFYIQLDTPPARFRVDILAKLYEDFTRIVLFCTLLVISLELFLYIIYGLKKRKQGVT